MSMFPVHLYLKLKERSLGGSSQFVPKRYWSNFVCLGGSAEHITILRRLIGRSERPLKVLIVGVFGGRDFWALKVDGHDVVGMDLAAVDDCPPTIVGDAEKTWPFPDGGFDVVVMGEVLEHLVLDHFALREAWRVLKLDGRLICTVPYLHDVPDYHVRIHTPRTAARLLIAAGFRIKASLERPGIIPLHWLNYASHATSLVTYLLFGKTCYGPLISGASWLEWHLGRAGWIPRRFMKMAGLCNWGGMFLAERGVGSPDYKQLNVAAFLQDASAGHD